MNGEWKTGNDLEESGPGVAEGTNPEIECRGGVKL
jgi:hypothetical protein